MGCSPTIWQVWLIDSQKDESQKTTTKSQVWILTLPKYLDFSLFLCGPRKETTRMQGENFSSSVPLDMMSLLMIVRKISEKSSWDLRLEESGQKQISNLSKLVSSNSLLQKIPKTPSHRVWQVAMIQEIEGSSSSTYPISTLSQNLSPELQQEVDCERVGIPDWYHRSRVRNDGTSNNFPMDPGNIYDHNTMIFDKNTRTSWQKNNIKAISLLIEKKWCAWEKVEVVEGISPLTTLLEHVDDTDIYARPHDHEFLRNLKITWVNGKWIVSSDAIMTHCGCGSSFSRKTGNPLQDKIREMKLRMKEKKEGIHI